MININEEIEKIFRFKPDGCKPSDLSELLARIKGGLEYLASFQCQHGEPDCFHINPPRGACCNSCWAKSWAKQILDEIDNER